MTNMLFSAVSRLTVKRSVNSRVAVTYPSSCLSFTSNSRAFLPYSHHKFYSLQSKQFILFPGSELSQLLSISFSFFFLFFTLCPFFFALTIRPSLSTRQRDSGFWFNSRTGNISIVSELQMLLNYLQTSCTLYQSA